MAGCRGETWGYKSSYPKGFNYLLPIAEAAHARGMGGHGIQARRWQAVLASQEKAYLLVPAGNQGPGFLMLHTSVSS